MSTVIVAILLISIIVSISLFLVSVNNRHAQKTTTALLTLFSKLGTENNLSFTSQEILENCIIGLDGIKRKLLILNKIDTNKYESILLDLNEVKNCFKRKIYRSVNIGTRKKEKFETKLDKIVLAFDFIDNRQPVHVLFFDPSNNHILTMLDLEQKANNWEAMLLRLVNTGVKKIAQ